MIALASSMALVAGWSLARPWGALGLGLAALILLASLLRRSTSRDAPRPLGTARFLDDAEGESERGARLRLPPSRLLAIAAVVSGSLALAGPVAPAPDAPAVRLVVHVDRSPSMHLPADPDAPGGPTRLEAAAAGLVEAASTAAWTRALGGEARLVWRDAGGNGAPIAGEALPGTLARPPRPPGDEPRWAALDLPGTVWLTDRAPGTARRAAGVAASGGPPVPGPLGWSPGGPLVETADGRLEVRPGAATTPSAHVAAGTDDTVRGVVEAWAADRGVALARGADGAGLLVAPEDDGESGGDAEVEGAGWSAPATGARGPRPWDVRPGRVALRFAALAAPPSDPIAFASDLADALDVALLLPRDYVPRGERAAAGPAVLAPPRAPLDADSAAARREARERRARLARLAAGAAALVGAALALAAGLLRLAGR